MNSKTWNLLAFAGLALLVLATPDSAAAAAGAGGAFGGVMDPIQQLTDFVSGPLAWSLMVVAIVAGVILYFGDFENARLLRVLLGVAIGGGVIGASAQIAESLVGSGAVV